MALTGDVANLIVALRLDDRGFTGKLNAAAAQLNAMDRGMGQIGRGAGQLAGGIGRLATVGLAAAAGGLAAFVTTAASFEQAEAGIRKTVGGTTSEVDDLVESIRQMSRTVPLSFQELAAIAAEGGALGIATDQIANFTDIVARLAVSTDLSAEAAASALGHLANVLHLEDEELRDFGDSLVALGNDGASTESQILDMTARFGAAGKQAGLSNEAILALASTTASMGVEAEAGGGALSRIFQGITLDIGTASKEGVELADAMGLSLAELRTAWDRDAGAVFGELLEHINTLDKFESAQFLKNLGITNVRDINAIQLLASGVEEYNEQLAISEGQTNELNRESDVFFNTTAGKWEILKQNVALAADTIGSELLPIVNELGDEFVAFLSDPKTQAGLKDFAKDLAQGVRDVVEQIRNADFGPLLDTFRIAGGIAKAGFDAFRALPPGVQALALAAIGVNKLTGGALTQIAAGMGNILGGAIKLAIPALNRGQTALNPMYVKDVAGGLGNKNGPGGPTGTNWFGLTLAAISGAMIGWQIQGPQFEREVAGGKDFFEGEIDARITGGNLPEMERSLANLEASMAALNGKTPDGPGMIEELAFGADLGGLRSTMEAERDALLAAIAALKANTPAGNPELGSSSGGVTWTKVAEETSKRTRDFLGAKLDELPDAAMLAPGMSSLTTNLPQLPSILSEIKGVKSAGTQQLSKTGESLAAIRFGNSKLESIRLKKAAVVVNLTANTSVLVSASQVASKVASHVSSTGGGAFII